MLDYCCKYQNNYISSFLFTKNLPSIFDKGVQIQELLDSSIFNFAIDFDGWPNVHLNDDRVLKHYNGSLFDLRGEFKNVFPEAKYQKIESTESLLSKAG